MRTRLRVKRPCRMACSSVPWSQNAITIQVSSSSGSLLAAPLAKVAWQGLFSSRPDLAQATFPFCAWPQAMGIRPWQQGRKTAVETCS